MKRQISHVYRNNDSIGFYAAGSTGHFGEGDFETPNSCSGKKEEKMKDVIQVKKT